MGNVISLLVIVAKMSTDRNLRATYTVKKQSQWLQ